MSDGEDRLPDQEQAPNAAGDAPGDAGAAMPSPAVQSPATGLPPTGGAVGAGSAVPRPPAHGLGDYPIGVDVDVPDRIARWRPLVQWFLAIPLFIVLYVLRLVTELVAFVGWFVALFTGRLPDGLGMFIAGYFRYEWRTYSYSGFLRDRYPSFGFVMGYRDPGDDPAWFEVRKADKLSRLAVLFRIILVIPQAIALFFIAIAVYVVMLVAFFVVTITGRWPDGLRDFVVGATRWFLRVDAWFLMLADPYPPFALH